MPKLNVKSSVVAFQDAENASNPTQKYVDWSRSVTGVEVQEVFVERHVVAPGSLRTIEESVGGLLVDVSGTFTIKPHPSKLGQYQVTSAALNSLAQSLAVVGASYSFTPLVADGTTVALRCEDTISAPPADPPEAWVLGGPLASLQRGDRVYVPSAEYGDTGGFSYANAGFWEVVRVGAYNGNPGSEAVLKRVDISDPVGAAETITITDKSHLQRIKGVRPYRKALVVADGSAVYYSGVWQVADVAKGWFSIKSDVELPLVMNAQFERLYITNRYITYLRVEADRVARLEYASGTSTVGTAVILPVEAGNPKATGWFETFGFVTECTVLNTTPENLTLNVVYAFDESLA